MLYPFPDKEEEYEGGETIHVATTIFIKNGIGTSEKKCEHPEADWHIHIDTPGGDGVKTGTEIVARRIEQYR